MFGKSLTASWPAGAQIGAAAVVAIGGLSLTTSGVWAALQATASGPAVVTNSGNLTMTLTSTTDSVGFTSAIANMVPGDLRYRFVTVKNGDGTAMALVGEGLTVSATGTGSTKLTTDATLGLQLKVTTCSVAWTLASSVWSCTGTQGTELTKSVQASGSAPLTITTADLPASTDVAANAGNIYLRVGVELPDANSELRVNGAAATTEANGTTALTGGSIQGLTTNLTISFTTVQKTGTTTSL